MVTHPEHGLFERLRKIEQEISETKNGMWEHLSAAHRASQRIAGLQRLRVEVDVKIELIPLHSRVPVVAVDTPHGDLPCISAPR